MTPNDLEHVDIQGIPWRLSEHTREAYRRTRQREYAEFERNKNVRVFPSSGASRHKPTALYRFRLMNRMDSCTINHFQLRHLLAAPSVRGVYFPRTPHNMSLSLSIG